MLRISTAAVAALGSTLLVGTALAADVTFERLRSPEPQNWLMNHGDYNAHHYSALERINKGNVKNLRFAFSVALGQKSGNENILATPLVDDGSACLTGPLFGDGSACLTGWADGGAATRRIASIAGAPTRRIVSAAGVPA